MLRQIPTQRRLLHTTSINRAFLDYFKFKKTEEKKQKQQLEKPEALDKVIAKAESNEIDPIKSTKLNKIEFIGKLKHDPRTDAEKLNGFTINKWLNSKKITDSEKFEKLLIQEYQELKSGKIDETIPLKLDEILLDDLTLRFDLTKQIQKKSGILIPDYVLTKITTLKDLQDFFHNEIDPNKPKHYNAKHLDIKSLNFESSNISIQQPVTSKERKSTFKKLLKDAKLSQEIKASKLIEESRD